MSGSLPVLGLVAAFLIGPRIEPMVSPTGEGPVQLILESYEQAMCPLKSFEADFTRIVYEGVWKVEHHSSGRVYFDAAGNARIELIPDKVEANQRGARYEIRPASSYTKWIFKAGLVFQFTQFDQVVKFSDRQPHWPFKTVENPEGRITWQSAVPPIILGMTASELQRKFQIRFVNHTAGGQLLSFVPLKTDRYNRFERMDVIFDNASGLPIATKLFDKVRREEVIVFDRATLKVNQPLQPGDDPLELEPNEFERLLRE